MEPSTENRVIECLNTLIKMAQWDKNLPLYFACLFEKPEQYERALQLIREAPKDAPAPAAPGNALAIDEWRKFFEVITGAAPLRELFAGDRDPFQNASPSDVSLLAEVSDLTTDTQTIFYSRNGTFHLVFDAVRQQVELNTNEQQVELNTKELIIECLNKFYMLFDTNKDMAELLYQLACSFVWFSVLASLKDASDYTADEGVEARETLREWNKKLTTELRFILLQPTNLFRVPKTLVKLAWERQDLFKKALDSIPDDKRSHVKVELRRQVCNVAYPLFVTEAKVQLEAIESDLRLLAVVAKHYVRIRHFVKLDGLVYAWPKVARLAMANYRNLEYVEGFFIDRKPRPSDSELEARDARELYELCESNPALIRFLRLKPYFTDINENELRRYRPLAPGAASTAEGSSSAATSQNVSTTDTARIAPGPATQSRVCELVIQTMAAINIAEREFNFEVSLRVSNKEVAKGRTTFSTRKLLDRMLQAIGVTSEDSLQSVMKGLFSGTNGEQVLVRGGAQLFNALIVQSGLEQPFAEAFQGDQPVRLIIVSNQEELHYLPWEWFPRPRPGYAELLLSHTRFSLVRCKPIPSRVSQQSFSPPIRLMGFFPNSPLGSRDISESSKKALDMLTSEGVQYVPLVGDDATFVKFNSELITFSPQILHFEGYVQLSPEIIPSVGILFSSPEPTTTELVDLPMIETSLSAHRVQLFVIGRNEASRVYGNPGPILSSRMARVAVPAVLAPIRAVEDVTSSALTTEFYRAFFAGNTLEHALYIARRKVAARGGDWTAFALFADPWLLDFFQPLPATA